MLATQSVFNIKILFLYKGLYLIKGLSLSMKLGKRHANKPIMFISLIASVFLIQEAPHLRAKITTNALANYWLKL